MAVVQLVGGKWDHKAEDVNAGWYLVRQRRSSLLRKVLGAHTPAAPYTSYY